MTAPVAPEVVRRRAGGDDVVVSIRPTRSGQAPSAGPVRSDPKPSDEQALLQELWQISHFGWISEAAIRRALTIAGGQEISAVAVAERLRGLAERGWVEQRHAGTDEHEWRLTDSGRSAR